VILSCAAIQIFLRCNLCTDGKCLIQGLRLDMVLNLTLISVLSDMLLSFEF
jgi:hypothetical protein